MTCKCGAPADAGLKLNGKPICRVCAHNISHSRPLGSNFVTAISGPVNGRGVVEIACPVTDEKGNVIPWGRYPNGDWT